MEGITKLYEGKRDAHVEGLASTEAHFLHCDRKEE
jgi:hypothetical protein